ncbi:hypothetical protein EJ08DRAFT_238409 [Tothia fuscella]|uniref:Glycosyltransferase 2-like domain-containing protein n=1 Tax=Tothia fuscella TaxID=1048955 RepID=A0A9P4TZ64_9PEZI|nr:hypothetical protein EJ08DRAFT_238409 [Tothia fuscella]
MWKKTPNRSLPVSRRASSDLVIESELPIPTPPGKVAFAPGEKDSSESSGTVTPGARQARTSKGTPNGSRAGSRDASRAGPRQSRGTSLTSPFKHHLAHADFDDEARFRTMVRYMYSRIAVFRWIEQPGFENWTGVLLRRSRGEYTTAPETVQPMLLAAVCNLNVEIAFTMRTETTNVILSILEDHQTDMILTDGSQLQIVDSLKEVATTTIKKFQYACLVRQEGLLLVWHDDLQQILPHAQLLEEKLVSMIWGATLSPFGDTSTLNSLNVSRNNSAQNLNLFYEKPAALKKSPLTGVEEIGKDEEERDEEMGVDGKESLARPVLYVSAVFVGLGMCLVIVLLLGFAVSKLLVECLVDGKWLRMVLVVTVPLLMAVALFFAVVIFTDLAQVFGPIGGIKKNSRNFSAIKPSLRAAYSQGFAPPHITIQVPVYKEGLEGVIIPTVKSLKAAISHYESHGGTASIFINDDGMRVVDEEEAQARMDFYHDNNIGWTARPKDKTEGYIRKGRFKKASNMNFALNASLKVETYIRQMMVELTQSRNGDDMITQKEEAEMYKIALDRVLDENPLLTGAGNIRLGELILIVDSDTRIPHDCLLYGAAEMYLSPEVAIVQHNTAVLQVVGDYFENGITYFTNLVYTSIRFSVGCGEVAPFVGHNGFLRWQAVQSVGVPDPDGYTAFWSESHVSEDFDLALRLQIAGNVVRCASYHDDGFKEGVSLTIFDELARWEKYAYGCSELVFHPFKYWIYKGPFTPLFRKFLWSDLILSSKCTILAYMASYFALASGATLTTANYFLIGWFNGDLDKFYMSSWNVFVSLIVVFNLGGNLCLAILRYRLGDKPLVPALLENFKWMPMFTIFFGGLSFHLTCAILSHLLSINMQWGATAKEKVDSNFFEQVPKIFKTFKYMYIIIFFVIAGMIYLGCFAPRGWEIQGVTAIVPLAVTLVSHALMPFLLNPSLMVMSY